MLSLHDHGGFAPCPEPFNLAAHVLAAGRAALDKIALSVVHATGAERWSFGRLIAAIDGTATGLLEAGLAPGEILLMRLGNSVDFPIAYLGAITAGIVPVPTSSQLTAPEVARMIAELDPAAILRAPGVACPESPVAVFDAARYRSWRDLPPAPPHLGASDRLGYIVYTSGTSGRPRPVAHAHRAIWARQMMMRDWVDLQPADRMLHAGAFNWTFTLGTGLLDPWTQGASALIPRAGTDPAQLALLMRRFEATLFAAAPGVFRQMLRLPMPPLPKLRHALSAGEKLSETLRHRWAAATGGGQIYEAYGLSECSTFLSAAPGRPADPGALGYPQTGRRVAILGPDGAPVPIGDSGTIAVHASDPGLMLGYRGAPEETAARFAGPWFLTGDRAHMRADGQIVYEGRDDDMMNAGGYRVSPLEVEAALSHLPGIEEIAVTDLAVREDVRVIAAFYTGPEDLDPDALGRAASEVLARYKQPRAWIRVAALPRNPNGKLLRKALKDLGPN